MALCLHIFPCTCLFSLLLTSVRGLFLGFVASAAQRQEAGRREYDLQQRSPAGIDPAVRR